MATIYACQAKGSRVRANRHLIHDSSRDLQEDVVPSVEHGSSTLPPQLAVPLTPPPLPLLTPLSPVAQWGARTALTVSLPNYKRASNTSSHCIILIGVTIIECVHQYMDEPNHLDTFENSNNINRRKVVFTRIDANLPQLQDLPIFQYKDLMLFSFGPFQVRQARSYYGEHNYRYVKMEYTTWMCVQSWNIHMKWMHWMVEITRIY